MSNKIFYLSLGSNINPAQNIPACLSLLKKKYPSIRFSAVYETDPVGPAGSEKFWNLAAEISVSENLSEDDLRKDLRKVESQLGRVRSETNRFIPRVIDIDILPQPGYENQAFIIIPLAELAGNTLDPVTGKTFSALAEELKPDSSGFQKMMIEDISE